MELQVAKGFCYRKGENGALDRIASLKPARVAELVASDVAEGLQVLVWTVFDAESAILGEELTRRGIAFEALTGKTPEDGRQDILERFKRGATSVLVSRASMLGFGMNFQCCGSMVFSGWSDSYEAYYQAVRRAYRHGQTKAIRVHVPVIPELEGDMLDNIWRKQGEHEAAIAEMEANYVRARLVIEGAA